MKKAPRGRECEQQARVCAARFLTPKVITAKIITLSSETAAGERPGLEP